MPTSTQPTLKSRWQEIKDIWNHEYTALWLLPGVLMGLCAGFVLGWLAQGGITGAELRGLLENFLPEALGIGLTVTILYYFDQWRSEKREDKRLKDELLWQVGSQSNELAKSAVDRIRFQGWLTGEDGLLRNAYLRLAQLRDAYLKQANLEAAMLAYARLQSANLKYVNLQNADLKGARLQDAKLEGTDLRGANLYKADFENAEFYDTGGLENALILPDGVRWTPDTDITRFTDPKHPNFWRSENPASPAYRGKVTD